MTPSDQEIELIADLVNDLCGLYLDATKGYLIESRLGDLLHEAGCRTYTELYRTVRHGDNPQLRNKIIDVITTHETLFFRDQSPYDALQFKALPETIDSKSRTAFPQRLRIWSAACSTGQEPYSIGMTLMNMIPDIHDWDIQILGTDVSDAAVQTASRGWFSQFDVQRGLPDEYRTKFFIPESNGWRIKDELRGLVSFRRKNLLESLDEVGRFDIIFCRNVAIYFSPSQRSDLFLRLADRLTEDGYLFVGSAESLHDLGPRFAPQHHCRSVYYRPNLASHSQSH